MAVPASPPSILMFAGIGALVIWRLYSRVRRMVGRQRYSRYRPWFTVTLFPLLIVLIGFSAMQHTDILPWLGGGLVLGTALGVLGLRLTKFEVAPEGRFYTPSAHLGIALSSLLVVRIVYRAVQVMYFGATPGTFLGSPATLAVFGTLAGYYVAYAVGLLRWEHTATPAPPSPPMV